MGAYVLGIDQSTQGTKLLLFDAAGKICYRDDMQHVQHIDNRGWVEHDPEEIWQNLKALVKRMLQQLQLERGSIKAIGISNQRETAMAWNRDTGKPVYPAIVWQCARGAAICSRLQAEGWNEDIRSITGLPLSPYFSAAKLAWILENVDTAKQLMQEKKLCMGTMDSWLVFRMTKGEVFATDYSNASRTQLFNLDKLCWSEKAAKAFGINTAALPQVLDSDGFYGLTDFEGLLPEKVPIHAVMGDSHAALFGQGCHETGMAKATYGTGSSVMMNVGKKPVRSSHGLVTSLAWSLSGKPSYVLEGNINYTGAAISWLKDNLHLISSPSETEALARAANIDDHSYFVPAFTGLGAPYWEDSATGSYTGITRVTGKNEMVRAVVDAIAYQINDVVSIMQKESGYPLPELRVDGGPTRNSYLMQFQADMLNCPVAVPDAAELSAIGVAYAAGIASGVYETEKIFGSVKRKQFTPKIQAERRQSMLAGWHAAIRQTIEAAKEKIA